MKYRIFRLLLTLVLSLYLVTNLPAWAQDSSIPLGLSMGLQNELIQKDVMVGLRDVGNTKYVTCSVIINQPPERVWPIIANPFEFCGKISPRMKRVEVITDTANLSVLKITVDMNWLPRFSYIVESHYENAVRVDFHRTGGVFKDFRGFWMVTPIENGTKTAMTYNMYLDPGFLVPQCLVREALKNELPKLLIALKKHIEAISEHLIAPESHTILAAAVNDEIHK